MAAGDMWDRGCGAEGAVQYREKRQGTLGHLQELIPQLEVPPSHGCV